MFIFYHCITTLLTANNTWALLQCVSVCSLKCKRKKKKKQLTPQRLKSRHWTGYPWPRLNLRHTVCPIYIRDSVKVCWLFISQSQEGVEIWSVYFKRFLWQYRKYAGHWLLPFEETVSSLQFHCNWMDQLSVLSISPSSSGFFFSFWSQN